MMSDTVRKHPRTFAEAFPRSCEYACSLERPAKPLWRLLNQDEWLSLFCLACLAIALPFIFPG